MAKSDVIYLINPAGCMHEVTRDHARTKMKESAGYRVASKDQIKKYFDAIEAAKRKEKPFIQSHEKPLFDPWTPEPPEEQELPDQSLPKEKGSVKKAQKEEAEKPDETEE